MVLYSKLHNIAEEMLKDFSLAEILEANDLTDEDVLETLIKQGLIDVQEYETYDEVD